MGYADSLPYRDCSVSDALDSSLVSLFLVGRPLLDLKYSQPRPESLYDIFQHSMTMWTGFYI